jgi:hypothetical protein
LSLFPGRRPPAREQRNEVVSHSNDGAVERMICLSDVTGLWQRILIAWPDGRTDTTTEVFWLQGPCSYADLRIPAGRPARPNVTCLRDLDRTMLRFMARQEGFFGHLEIVDSVGQWHRAFDYQPDTGMADRGALAFENGILVERGIDVLYTEHWSCRSATGALMALLLATETGTPGCLVAAGDAFIYARGRTISLPRGTTLNQLIEGAPSLEAAQDIFDCEISFGRRFAGNWRIERSSHCFREGALLSPVLDSAGGRLVIDDVTPEGTRIKLAWRITGHESTIDAPFSLWFGSKVADGGPQPSEATQRMITETFGVAP